MACIISRQERKLSDIVNEIKICPFERFNLQCPDNMKFEVLENLQKKLSEEFDDVNTLDGVRVDFPDGWVLIRVSNTSPQIRLTVEADTEKRLAEIKNRFEEKLNNEIDSLKG